MGQRIDVMISSTRDLLEHRKQVMEAILRMSMYPIGVEYPPASPEDALDISLKVVDKAEIYLGIFAHRYGYIPDTPKNPDKVSITELEYRRALERDIPRLIFIMGDEHPLSAKDLETDPESAAKLLRFKNNLKASHVVNFFNSPEQLREQVIAALAEYRQLNPTLSGYISDIPKPPKPYIVHPYTLLEGSRVSGRGKELNLLTNWISEPSTTVNDARVLNIVAVGGMGKSTLAWKWFNDVAPYEMKPIAGRFWWSFYENDANFENFIIHALAYVSGRASRDIQENTTISEREFQLLHFLNENPYLIVMDGLERILIAYTRIDAAHLADDRLDEQTSNSVVGTLTPSLSSANTSMGHHLLRKTSDPRAGSFLRMLANSRSSRILITTRLYPADLQTVSGISVPGSYAYFLKGLDDADAIDLWRSLGASGSRDTLLPVFNSFDNYPLLIRVLAGLVARYSPAPGDFDEWRKANIEFIPTQLPLVQVKSHVLDFALQNMEENIKQVLNVIAAFRASANYETLVGILVGSSNWFSNESELDLALMELQNRGLLGWDQKSNEYDLHPIVRGMVWEGLSTNSKGKVYESLQSYFETIKKKPQSLEQDRSEEIEIATTLYRKLETAALNEQSQLKINISPEQLHNTEVKIRVFVSYSHDDGKDIAQKLENDLLQNGLEVWRDATQIKAGLDWEEAIRQGIDQSDAMIAIITEGAIKSHYVRGEWIYARDVHNMSVIPILSPGFDEHKLPINLRTTQWIDARNDYVTALDNLLIALKLIG